MTDLKPCPFCGLAGIATTNDTDDAFRYWVECAGNCAAGDCFARTGMQSTPEAASEAWNTRPAEEAYDARIAELEAENEELKEQQQECITSAHNEIVRVGHTKNALLLARIAELEASEKAMFKNVCHLEGKVGTLEATLGRAKACRTQLLSGLIDKERYIGGMQRILSSAPAPIEAKGNWWHCPQCEMLSDLDQDEEKGRQCHHCYTFYLVPVTITALPKGENDGSE